ncbi:hypothetical protein CKAH01_03784 [Colletotrichum kahawae]|uniref:Uncharacterized protein n=1 Tax=Colletotrichum kahawae TaxID=34407 RepID=A0AAE0DBD5_COLKA|nr:hypothetical protein CKAH01_03784 [Colletotrichum kahawae]
MLKPHLTEAYLTLGRAACPGPRGINREAVKKDTIKHQSVSCRPPPGRPSVPISLNPSEGPVTAEPIERSRPPPGRRPVVVVAVVVGGRWAPSSLAGPFLDQPERSGGIPCQKGDSSNDLWAWDARSLPRPSLFFPRGLPLGPDDP